MLKNNYMIVLYGEIQPGEDLQTVKNNMADLFHLAGDQVNILFSGNRQVVKKNIFNDTAMKYKYAIEKAGAVCHVEEEDKSSPGLLIEPESDPGDTMVSDKQICCPKCGYQAQDNDDPLITAHDGLGECPICGIIVSKYEAQNVPEELNDESEENFSGFDDKHIID